ncbi:MAG: YARHG domain-containing protein [Treponema sp.]|nr:YARHG domain-containing protein [Treponema sp.]
MKAKKIILILFIFNCTFGLFANDYDLPDVDDNLVGTYLPVDFESQLKGSKLFYTSLHGYSNCHDVLFLGKNKCYSDLNFHDGYAIRLKDFEEFRFVKNSSGTFCIDNNGYSYRKISNKLNDRGYGYREYSDYVLNLMFPFIKHMNTVQIDGFNLMLDGTTYEIILDGIFFETENVALWLRSENEVFALVKNGLNGELHKGSRGDEIFIKIDKKCEKEFPLMFLDDDKELPYYLNLPKVQYRYLRNLVYARHGYIFNSEDLNSYFNKFDWYKTNPSFTENELSKDEKYYIERILNLEKK